MVFGEDVQHILILVLMSFMAGCTAIERHDYFTSASNLARPIDKTCHEYIGFAFAGREIQLQGAPPVSEVDLVGGSAGVCISNIHAKTILGGPFLPFIPIFIIPVQETLKYLQVNLKFMSPQSDARIRIQDAYLETSKGERYKANGYLPGKFFYLVGNGKVRYSDCIDDRDRISLPDHDVIFEASGVVSYCFEGIPEENLQEIYFNPAIVNEAGVASTIKFHLKRVRGTSFIITG